MEELRISVSAMISKMTQCAESPFKRHFHRKVPKS